MLPESDSGPSKFHQSGNFRNGSALSSFSSRVLTSRSPRLKCSDWINSRSSSAFALHTLSSKNCAKKNTLSRWKTISLAANLVFSWLWNSTTLTWTPSSSVWPESGKEIFTIWLNHCHASCGIFLTTTQYKHVLSLFFFVKMTKLSVTTVASDPQSSNHEGWRSKRLAMKTRYYSPSLKFPILFPTQADGCDYHLQFLFCTQVHFSDKNVSALIGKPIPIVHFM